MHLVQVCNLGSICGGTAACAWTITRALPNWRHTLVFRSAISLPTIAAFAPVQTCHGSAFNGSTWTRLKPDIVLLHNTPCQSVARLPNCPVIDYRHSRTTPVAADIKLACSEWLRQQLGSDHTDVVLYQPVPRPLRCGHARQRALRDRPVVGRICTPTRRKWPDELIPFYERVASEQPLVDWEFVGCPRELEPELRAACRGRARFHPAGWQSRQHLWRWDALLYHHPTLTESFGRTVAESLRAGCIPIVDDRGGFREQVTAETGFLCATSTDFIEAIQQIRDPGRRRQLSRSAQSHGDERFSLRRFAQDWDRLLRSM
ncbi:MAG: glycosyltransferase family 4 protein [Planctomycetaceae bacterium]